MEQYEGSFKGQMYNTEGRRIVIRILVNYISHLKALEKKKLHWKGIVGGTSQTWGWHQYIEKNQ